MYTSDDFQIRDEETFTLRIPSDRDYKILQLTDLHLDTVVEAVYTDYITALASIYEYLYSTRRQARLTTQPRYSFRNHLTSLQKAEPP